MSKRACRLNVDHGHSNNARGFGFSKRLAPTVRPMISKPTTGDNT
jgi:hypothetical protein